MNFGNLHMRQCFSRGFRDLVLFNQFTGAKHYHSKHYRKCGKTLLLVSSD